MTIGVILRGPRCMTGACVLLLCVGTLVTASCGPASPPSNKAAPARAEDLSGPATWVYVGVRGRVTSLATPTSQLTVQHEHIPTFVHPVTGTLVRNANGSTGMRAMAMPMPPAAGLDVSTLSVGDVIEFTLSVWDGKATGTGTHAWRMTAFTELPSETKLDFADKASSEPDAQP